MLPDIVHDVRCIILDFDVVFVNIADAATDRYELVVLSYAFSIIVDATAT